MHSIIEPQHQPVGVAHRLAVICHNPHRIKAKAKEIATPRTFLPLLVIIFRPTFEPILGLLLDGLPLLSVHSNLHTSLLEKQPMGVHLPCIGCICSFSCLSFGCLTSSVAALRLDASRRFGFIWRGKSTCLNVPSVPVGHCLRFLIQTLARGLVFCKVFLLVRLRFCLLF